jgi:hypothetical protein
MREATMPVPLLLLVLAALLPGLARAEIWLGTPPMGWEDFDSHVSAAYNESFARKSAAVQAEQLLPSGYDTWIIGGTPPAARANPGGQGSLPSRPPAPPVAGSNPAAAEPLPPQRPNRSTASCQLT